MYTYYSAVMYSLRTQGVPKKKFPRILCGIFSLKIKIEYFSGFENYRINTEFCNQCSFMFNVLFFGGICNSSKIVQFCLLSADLTPACAICKRNMEEDRRAKSPLGRS